MEEGAPIDGIGVQSHFKDAERNVDPIQVQSKVCSKEVTDKIDLRSWLKVYDHFSESMRSFD